MKLPIYLSLPIVVALFIVAASIGYFFIILSPQREQRIIRSTCLDSIEKEKDEIKKLTTYDPFVDERGCFLEAGCMKGVTDQDYASKFDYCNRGYYDTCFADVKAKAVVRFATEKEKRVQDCIVKYNK